MHTILRTVLHTNLRTNLRTICYSDLISGRFCCFFESLRTGEDGVALESYSQMAFTTKVSARAVDVLIGSEDYMDGFEFKDEYFMDLTELLPEDVYQVFGEQDDKYSITIDSDELAEELEVTYEPVKIGVLANSENVENAVKWLTKLAEELS